MKTSGKKKGIRSKSRKTNLILLTMTLPTVIWLILLRYVPMAGIVIAFKKYKIAKPPTLINNIIQSEWVGFKNFKFLFATTDSLIMIRNTVLYNFFWIVLGILLAVTFAIILTASILSSVFSAVRISRFEPYGDVK